MRFVSSSNGGNCNGCGWTAAEGTIVEDTPAAFAEFLKTNHPQGSITFNSPGGNLWAGLKLGAMIRDLGLSANIGRTVDDGVGHKKTVPGICASACAYAFLGGKTRYAEKGFGVHQFFDGRSLEEQLKSGLLGRPQPNSVEQSTVGLLTLYVKSMGVDTDLVFVASSTAPDSVYWLSTEELSRYKINNSGTTQEPWKSEPYLDGAIATTSIRVGGDDKLSMTIFCRKIPASSSYLLLSRRIFGVDGSRTTSAVTADELKKSFFSWSLEFDSRSRNLETTRSPIDVTNVAVARDGNAYVTLPLTREDFDSLITSKVVQVRIDQARVWGFPFYGSFSLNGAAPHLRLAMRNCLMPN